MGFLQGSVLGPLLFLMYINDLPKVLESSSACMFTDDSKIAFSYMETGETAKPEKDLRQLFSWANKMQLT